MAASPVTTMTSPPEKVILFYERGGIRNPHLDTQIRPLHLSGADIDALVDFLGALMGRIHGPRSHGVSTIVAGQSARSAANRRFDAGHGPVRRELAISPSAISTDVRP
jgi:hypothetical protein